MAGFSYNRLFNTKIVHDFYVGGISKKDLAVVPVASTALAMKNNNMLFRNDDGGFRVLYKADDTGAPFIPFSNVRLTFAVKLLNVNEFLNFTDLTGYTPEKILYFTNIGSVTTTELNYSMLDYLRPVSFTYPFPSSQVASSPTDIGHIQIKDPAGNIVSLTFPNPDPNTLKPDAELRFSYPVNLTGMPKGIYEFETWINAGSHVIKRIYVDNELASQGAFGIVDIMAISAADANYPGSPGPPPTDNYRLYEMKFERRKTQWKYIVVLKSTSVIDPLPAAVDIVDEDFPDPVYGGELFFSTASGYIDVNGFNAKVITSVATNIPYYQVPKKGLTIKINTAETILTNIPGPPLGVVSAQKEPLNFGITEIFVFI